jgi:hypothetical protein
MEARALVTGRLRPLRIGRGQVVHQVGLPYNYGRFGLANGDSPNELIPLSMDPNVSIHEAKSLTCNIRPGRRAPYAKDVIDEPVPASERTPDGQPLAHGIDDPALAKKLHAPLGPGATTAHHGMRQMGKGDQGG